MDVFKNLPDILLQEQIEYFACSYESLNQTSWNDVLAKLNPDQFNQVSEYIGQKIRKEYEKIPEEVRDAHYIAGAIHTMRDCNYVPIKSAYSKEYNSTGIIEFYKKYPNGSKYRSLDEDFTFYSEKDSPFAMCYSCKIEIDNLVFNSATQYIAYAKAEQFRDRPLMKTILESDDSEQCYIMSQKIKGYLPEIYDMMIGIWLRDVINAKFTQKKDLQDALLATIGTTLALADTRSNHWGIGLNIDNPLSDKRIFWNGKNILGELLTELRVKLMNEY
jgi:ribA/ribD-fused uncharacterized protein